MQLQAEQPVAQADPRIGDVAPRPDPSASSAAVLPGDRDSFANLVRHDLQRAVAGEGDDQDENGATGPGVLSPEEANAELRRQIEALLGEEPAGGEAGETNHDSSAPRADASQGEEHGSLTGATAASPAEASAENMAPGFVPARATPADQAAAADGLTEKLPGDFEPARAPQPTPEESEVEAPADAPLDDELLAGSFDEVEAVPQPLRPLDDAAGSVPVEQRVKAALADGEQAAEEELRARVVQREQGADSAAAIAPTEAAVGKDAAAVMTPPQPDGKDTGPVAANDGQGAAKDVVAGAKPRRRPSRWALAGLRLADMPFAEIPDDFKHYIGVAGALLLMGGVALILAVHFHVLGH